jgi:hypothetical protein
MTTAPYVVVVREDNPMRSKASQARKRVLVQAIRKRLMRGSKAVRQATSLLSNADLAFIYLKIEVAHRAEEIQR